MTCTLCDGTGLIRTVMGVDGGEPLYDGGAVACIQCGPRCTVPCDDDCDALCHEWHQPIHRKRGCEFWNCAVNLAIEEH